MRLLQEEHLHKKAGNAHLPLTSAVDPEVRLASAQ